ncbi:MAG TPA: HAD family phosphatase [Phycisphaerae bacterium]|nr:HAD family phosphatase [Phycisphaerae bacterium]
MSRLEAVIYDFDGVVVDSEPIHLRGFQQVLKDVGLSITSEEYYGKYLGFDDHDCFVAVMKDNGKSMDDQLLQELTAKKTRLMLSDLAESINPLPGAVELIRSCRAAGLAVGVCSGALRDEIILASKSIGAIDSFMNIVSAEDVERGKPDPEGYQIARKNLSDLTGTELPAGNCVVVEDSPAGIKAAKDAGMNVLAVTTSYPADRLTQADRIVASLGDVSADDLAELVG